MSYPTAPDAAAVIAFMSAAGVSASSSVDYTLEAAAALEWWERVTGWSPFLVDAAPSTVLYSPPEWGTRLKLFNGYTAITEVLTNVAEDGSGGDTRTQYEEWKKVFWKEPTQEGWIHALDMRGGWGNGWRSIKITGTKGCVTTLPARVYRALLCRAALTSYGQVTGSLGRLSEIKQGPVSQKFDTTSNLNWGVLGTIVTGWDAFSQEVAVDYTRELV